MSDLKGFKKCNLGHFFKSDLAVCPYCPKTQNSSDNKQQYDKTDIAPGGRDNYERATEVANPGAKTEVYNDQNNYNGVGNNNNFDRTVIIDVESNNQNQAPKQRVTRKLVGWIVTYTFDEMGLDYKLYEGRNTIGTKDENDITIINDYSISGVHAFILFRNGRFYLRDEMTTNGTYLNNVDCEPSESYELKDGDTIKCANTIFKFKTAF